AKLAQTIDEYGITTVHFVPSIYALYVARQKNNTVTISSLRHVFVSGEALKPAVVDAHYQFFDVPLHNLYGPTEATVDVTYYRTAAYDKLIPIGRPIDNIQVYILDGDRQLCRPGVVGEIALAGVGLARGYLNQPELTSSKFINVDWSSQRLYLTGDIGRQLESGDTLYMHRADDQVKINGNRIELGEVENTLMIHDNVDLVVCCVNENRERIDFVAFVKLNAGSNVSEADLRQFLEKRIPSYMIPLRFVVVDHIPFTTSGKADRARLIQTSLSLKATGKVNAETDAEKMIFEIWKSVLELDDISVTDNFLMIGGDSVRIVILFEKLELSLPGVFQVHELYHYNTIRAQARLIESRGLIDAPLTEVAQSIKIDF
ncbi:MAG: non-ribosomal peptide synthetase, partial [Flammeovirgaceae bacterium]